MNIKLYFGLELLVFIQAILISFSVLIPKPNERWINFLRWNPELSYYMAYISQMLFPAVEMIIIAVILIDPDTYEMTGPLVFACLLDAGFMI